MSHVRRLLFRLLLVLLLPTWGASQAADGARAYVFWRDGCPHCERLRSFLGTHVAAHPEHSVSYFEIGADSAARDLLVGISIDLGAERVAVPFTVVGERYFVGYLDDETSGAQIVAALRACETAGCPDRIAPRLATRPEGEPGHPAAQAQRAAQTPARPRSIDLPFLGRIDIADLSLPLLTLVLAGLDGFNPCAMWTLVFLVGLLLGMQDRLRMWILGVAFLAASAAVYFVFMAAWLNTLLALGMVPWIRAGVGLLAVGGGGWYLREFLLHRDEVCRVTAPAHRQRVFQRLKAVALERNFLLALAAIMALAVAVNLVELVCSAGIPAVYTQILALTPLPAWQYYGYLVFYIVVFMLDDLLVFVIAMTTLRATGLGTRYARWSHLVGGLVLVAVGVLLLAKPAWLAF
jgi:hypothetical protein